MTSPTSRGVGLSGPHMVTCFELAVSVWSLYLEVYLIKDSVRRNSIYVVHQVSATLSLCSSTQFRIELHQCHLMLKARWRPFAQLREEPTLHSRTLDSTAGRTLNAILASLASTVIRQDLIPDSRYPRSRPFQLRLFELDL